MKQDIKVKLIPARAIDVGYQNVKFTTGRKRGGGDVEIECGLFAAFAPTVSANQLLHAQGTQQADAFAVNVNGNDYMVGNKAKTFTRGIQARHVDAKYCMSDPYYALFLAALKYIADAAEAGQECVIDTLGVGLPLNTYAEYHKALEEKLTGEHLIGRAGGPVTRRVSVNHVQVMVQPHGALVNFGSRPGNKLDGATLVVDPGGGTLDWVLIDEDHEYAWTRSGAFPQAMLHISQIVAEEIQEGLSHDIAAMASIDKALRLREPTFRIGPHIHEMQKYRTLVDAALDQSVKAMLEKTGPLTSVGRILFTGGGAAVFREYMERHYKQWREAMEIDVDPVYSNVRGFQVVAEQIAEDRGART